MSACVRVCVCACLLYSERGAVVVVAWGRVDDGDPGGGGGSSGQESKGGGGTIEGLEERACACACACACGIWMYVRVQKNGEVEEM